MGVINGTRRKIQIQKSDIFHTFSRNNFIDQFIWNRRTCIFLQNMSKYEVNVWRMRQHMCACGHVRQCSAVREREISVGHWDILAGHCPTTMYIWTCLGVHDWWFLDTNLFWEMLENIYGIYAVIAWDRNNFVLHAWIIATGFLDCTFICIILSYSD